LVEILWLQFFVLEFFFQLVAEFLGVVITMKTIYRFLFCILAFLMTGSCAVVHDSVLESKDVQFFKVEELPRARPTRLIISGLVFKSALSVNKITTKTEGSVTVVMVHLALAKPGTSGSFQYELPVPDSVDEVRFGSTATSIWKRGSSSVHLPN
jgi:hypothetical protein